jgi:hypothetical protein
LERAEFPEFSRKSMKGGAEMYLKIRQRGEAPYGSGQAAQGWQKLDTKPTKRTEAPDSCFRQLVKGATL